MESNILIRNEKEANKLAAQVTLLTIIFIAFVYLLNVVGIFIVPAVPMTIAMGAAAILLLIPSLIVFLFKRFDAWVKYAIVTLCTLMVSVISLLLTWHVVLLFIFPIAVASLYFSRKLSWYAVILSLVLFSASQLGALHSGGVVDHNLNTTYDVIMYAIAPRSIEVLALSLIFIRLSFRTKMLLQNVVGAQEQKETLDQMLALTDKSYEVTNVLAHSVKELSVVTSEVITANEQITKMTSDIVDDSQQTIRYVDDAGAVVADVISNLKIMASENVQISSFSKETKHLTINNKANMNDAANSIRQIDEATKKSREVILRLGEKSNEIMNITNVIKGITKNTSLLSLNASIESARAGEHGRGFAVVAEQIRNLASQSQQAADDIAKLIQIVVADTNEAVQAMDYNTKLVEDGLSLMQKADQSSEEVAASIEKVNSMADNVASLSDTISENGDKINSAVAGISNLTLESMDRLKEILTSSEEQLRGMNEVSVYVKSIDTTSDELLAVVNK